MCIDWSILEFSRWLLCAYADGKPRSDQAQAIQPSYSELLEENNRLRSPALRGPVTKTARPLSSLVLMDQQEQEIYVSLRSHYRPAGIANASDVIYPSDDCCRIMLSQAAGWAWLHSAVSAATLEQQKLHSKPYEVNRQSPSPSEASWLALYFSHLAVRVPFSI